MKILILGLGKSGTTAMVYKTAGGLPNCRAFSGGVPGKYVGNYENAVYKHTYEARKGKDFDLYREHLRRESYDRRIWMARDLETQQSVECSTDGTRDMSAGRNNTVPIST